MARDSHLWWTILAGVFWAILLGAAGCTNLEKNDLDARVKGTLARHPQGEDLARWYGSLATNSLEHDATQWILAWLPDSDLASLDLVLLQEHVNLACQTYRHAPWHDVLPRDTWLHFVVPHRVSQEPLQPWRRVLQTELAPVVAGHSTMEEAALAVNRWCREQATYISTSGRDMGPLTTLKRGLGRCEEEMILTICALRAAGIPARTCSTPYWTFTDDNHAWVEVWADGRWYYAESCDDRRCLNDAWFSGAASRAGFVRSVGYGQFDPRGEPLYRAEDGVTIINSTSVYTDPFLLRASVVGHSELPVFVNVLNYGTIRAIARLDQEKALALGPGSFALTATAPDSSGDLLLKMVTGEPGQVLEVELNPEIDCYDTEESPGFWLTYPEAGSRPRRQEVCVSDQVDRHHRLLVAADQAQREKLRTLDAVESAILDSLPAQLRPLWDEILEKPCESFSPLIQLVTWYRDSPQRQALTWLLADADDKDLLELDERMIRAHVDLSVAAREASPLDIPDEIFREGVLAVRINREPGGDWRSTLPLIPWSERTEPQEVRSQILATFGQGWQQTEKIYFGNPLSPDDVFLLGRGTETDLKTAFVGLCRRNGVPARYRHGKVDLWLGSWQPVEPLAVKEADLQDQDSSMASAWLDLGLLRDGVAWPEAESYRNFMVSRPAEGKLETPWWDPELGIQEWDAGDFWFCATVRVPGGNAFGRLTRFTIDPGDTAVVRLPVDLDGRGWDPATLVDAKLKESLAGIWAEASADLPPAGLYLLFEPGEPATRMIPAVARLRDRLQARNLPVIPVLAGDSSPAAWRKKLTSAALPGTLYQPRCSVLNRWLADEAKHGPVTLLVLPEINDGLPVLLRSGLDNGIDFSVHLALDSHGNE